MKHSNHDINNIRSGSHAKLYANNGSSIEMAAQGGGGDGSGFQHHINKQIQSQWIIESSRRKTL